MGIGSPKKPGRSGRELRKAKWRLLTLRFDADNPKRAKCRAVRACAEEALTHWK